MDGESHPEIFGVLHILPEVRRRRAALDRRPTCRGHSTGFPGVEAQGSISLLADRPYDIKLEYVERRGLASVVLSWSSQRQVKQIVPRQRLRVAAAPQQPADGPGGASYPHAG